MNNQMFRCVSVACVVCVMCWGCKRDPVTSIKADMATNKVVQEQPLEGVAVEAQEEIELEGMPVLVERDAIVLPHPIYEVRYHATEDGTTRAWVEINDVKDEEVDGLVEHIQQFGDGAVVVPPEAPGIPARYAAIPTYTLIGGEYDKPFASKPVGFTYFKGPSEDHFVAVSIPEKKLKEGGYYVGVVGTHEQLSFSQPASMKLEGASGEQVLANVHQYVKRILRPEEREVLPGVLTPGDLQVVSGSWLKGHHAHLAVLDVVLDSSDKASDHISAMMLLNEAYEVTGLVEAPAKRAETFAIKGVLKVSSDDPGYLIYENLQYEGAYTYLMTLEDKSGEVSLIMLNGDGL